MSLKFDALNISFLKMHKVKVERLKLSLVKEWLFA